jgi:nicotinamidase-related amidase
MVDPVHSALVLWDCQNALVNSIFNREEFLANQQRMLASARDHGIPVIYTKITPLPVGFQSAWQILQSMKRFRVEDPTKIPAFMKPGSPESEIHEKLIPAEGDVVLNKSTSNIFFGTMFEQIMRFRGVKTIIFTGIATEIGIDHNAREAGIRGFYPVVVSDCVSSSDQVAHESVLQLLPRLSVVAKSADILNEWREK